MALFCGDTIFNESVGRTDFYSGSARTLGNSIRERIMTLPDDTKLYSGHGEKTTVGYEKKYNPVDKKTYNVPIYGTREVKNGKIQFVPALLVSMQF